MWSLRNIYCMIISPKHTERIVQKHIEVVPILERNLLNQLVSTGEWNVTPTNYVHNI